MTNHTISCPSCRHSFPLDLAFREQLRVEVTTEVGRSFDQRLAQQREELTRTLTQATETRLARAHAEKLGLMQTQLAAKEGALLAAQKQAQTARQQADEQARAEFVLERKALEQELARQSASVRALRAQEIALRREKQELEDFRHKLQVEHHRELEAARQAVRAEVSAALTEETRARELENQHQKQALTRQVEELRRKLEQGNAIAQGEIMELRIEEILRQAYPHDELEPVPRGINGGDLRQVVITPTGCRCGTILWETKRTKLWEAKWPAKMKADQRAARAEVAVIVTQVLPKDVRVFGQIEGVWVVHASAVAGFSLLARCGLLELTQQRHSIQGREEKAARLLDYICGHEHRQHFDALVGALGTQLDDLQKEQRAMKALWSKRGKQIENGLSALGTMYGDLQALVGPGALPLIRGLELQPMLTDM